MSRKQKTDDEWLLFDLPACKQALRQTLLFKFLLGRLASFVSDFSNSFSLIL